jgi:hypothetical protein
LALAVDMSGDFIKGIRKWGAKALISKKRGGLGNHRLPQGLREWALDSNLKRSGCGMWASGFGKTRTFKWKQYIINLKDRCSGKTHYSDSDQGDKIFRGATYI